ncbi:hypothetical protein F4859DRAFT_490050 [Xylaria cf. heliscus]|nr:hypothetical protein F4859DRAFT_490050 [Xylaria cf. heliscus]
MATNSGRGNSIDAADGPRGGNTDPPPVGPEVKDAIAKEASSAGGTTGSATATSTGVHAAGHEPGLRPDTMPKVEVKVGDPGDGG